MWIIGGIGLALVLGFVGTSVYGLWVYANHDRTELIDDPVVVDAIDPACAQMTATVKAATVSPDAPLARQGEAVRMQDRAVAAMIASVEALGPDRLANDRPTRDWLDDWQRLVDAREQYADALAGGRHLGWAVPTADGAPITARMKTVGICDVPAELLIGS